MAKKNKARKAAEQLEESGGRDSKGSGLNKSVVLFVLFLFSYGVLFALSAVRDAVESAVGKIPVLNWFLPFPPFDSPMYFLLPVVGFFFIYFIVDWVNEYYETRFALSPWFLLLFVAVALVAFYISLFWLFAEYARYQGKAFPEFDFWGELKGSAYYLFVFAGVLGWVSKKIIEKI